MNSQTFEELKEFEQSNSSKIIVSNDSIRFPISAKFVGGLPMLILVIIFIVYAIYSGITFAYDLGEAFPLLLSGLGLFSVLFFLNSVNVNLNDRTVTNQIAGLKIRTLNLDNIKTIHRTQNYSNGINSGISWSFRAK